MNEIHTAIKGELQRIILFRLKRIITWLPVILKYLGYFIFTVKYTVIIWRHVIWKNICEY